MNAKLITAIFLTTMPCAALGAGDTMLHGVPSLLTTDAYFGPAFAGALERLSALKLPAPAATPAALKPVELADVTEKWTSEGDVVSAFPHVYKLIHSEENSRIIKVFSFTDPGGVERRLEVFYTGGDWMQYGLTYFATTAGQAKDLVAIYAISDLSTPDKEDGEIAPKIDPFDPVKLAGFITGDFLDASGGVKPAFKSLASASVTR